MDRRAGPCSTPCTARGRAARELYLSRGHPTQLKLLLPLSASSRGGGSARPEVASSVSANACAIRVLVEREGAGMSSSGVGVHAGSSANEAPEIPDNVGDWLRGVYRFATDRNDFRRNLILNLGLFAAGVWLARNLSDIDLMAPQPGV